ncbi:MAG: EAL domain-containing protein [Acidimicrobiia bacterium]
MSQHAGLQGGATHVRSERELPSRVSWCFVAGAVTATGLSTLTRSEDLSSLLFDAIAIAAAAAAVYGILRNQPLQRGPWLLIALGLTLSAAGDVIYDLVLRTFGASTGYPWADLFYLPAYPCFAIGLWRLAGPRRRDTAADSAIVTLAAAAVIWQWVITPVVGASEGASLQNFVNVLYPIMDVVLVVAIVHAVFTLPNWITAARLLFAGLAVMLIADTVFARLVADGVYADGGVLDALWPLAYVLLAGAMLHPSMRDLWQRREPGIVRTGRARVVVLAAALFSVPAIVVIDGATSDEAIALTAIVAATATLVAWRIARLVTETNRAREELGEREARFRSLVQHSSDAIAVIGTDGTISSITASVTTMLGHRPADLVGRDVGDFVHPDDRSRAIDTWARLSSNPFGSEQVQLRARHSDHTWRWIEATCTNQLDQPAIRGIVGNFRDITERKRSEHAAVGETRVLELILDGAPLSETLHALLETIEAFSSDTAAVVRLIDADSGALHCIAAPSLPLSYLRELDEGLGFEGALEPSHEPAAEPALSDRWQEPVVIADIAASAVPADLASHALANGLRSFWSLPIRSQASDAPLGFLGVYARVPRTPTAPERQILERARDLASLAIDRTTQSEQLGFLALHDMLTELPNRALGVERLERAIESLEDHDGRLAVLFVDLDRFKLVNDGFGHETGDDLLVAVGRRLAGVVRRHDTVARFGGDEFVMICEQLESVDQALELAQRALDSLARPIALPRGEVRVSASIGIAITDRPTRRASDLLRDADTAMYRAKRRGGGRFEVFDQAMRTQVLERMLTERELRGALERNELLVQFQPQFDLLTGERVAVEALLRWQHPARGLTLPGQFMTVAEETGLIVSIGEWVMREVCEHVERARAESLDRRSLPIAVNVAGRQLLQSGFASQVQRSLAACGVEPSSVSFEIAERTLLADQDAVRDALNALKDIGLRLAIDDFGTGGSSLTYLRRYPFDELKIDGTFVAGLGRSAADDAIVAATIDMAHALGMVVAAEGIENDAQRVRLLGLGCDRGQGFHLGPPEPMDARHLRLVHTRPA